MRVRGDGGGGSGGDFGVRVVGGVGGRCSGYTYRTKKSSAMM